jgi:arabinofuranan 3-O-arabinosyltransferase
LLVTLGRTVRQVSARSGPERLVGMMMIGFFSVIIIGSHWGEQFVDTRPDLYLDPGGLVQESLHAWTGASTLGTPNYDTGYLPAAALIWVVQTLGAPAWLSMRVWRVALYVAAGLGARAFLNDLTRRRCGGAARVAAAVAYVVNPYVVVGAATTPIMLPYALFPWLLLAFRRSLSGSRWRGAAWFGLAFFAMGGMNAGVAPLMLLVALPVVLADVMARERVGWRTTLPGTLACLGAALLSSAYWVASSVSAFHAAAGVAAATEHPSDIAAVSSFAEVLRGLGGWLLYGADLSGPFRPGFVGYVDNPLVVVASFGVPIAACLGALLSNSTRRLPAIGLVVVGSVTMVGLYPPGSPSPFGLLLRAAFDHVPGLIAFRTTNKAGAVLMLGLAILVALGVDAVVPRLTNRGRWAAAVGAAAVLTVSVAPVWSGALFPGALPFPSYWRLAANDLDTREADGRVWLVPGETNSHYRWMVRGVDDMAPAMIDRPSFYRRTYPDVPRLAANLLAAADQPLQAGTMPVAGVSSLARYLAATDVLERNDMVWEYVGGGRPAVVNKELERDPGLRPDALYGLPGRNVYDSARQLGQTTVTGAGEATLPPLIRYRVADPNGIVQSFPSAGAVVVVGDNAGAVSMMGRTLTGRREYLLAGGLSPGELLGQLDQGARVVLTDTNRRVASNDSRLDATGPLLGAGEQQPGVRALFWPSDQTVASYRGVASVVSSTSGSVFGPVAYGRAALAFDGNPRTAWEVGDFNTAVGNWVQVNLNQPRPIRRVRITALNSHPVRTGTVDASVGTSVEHVTLTDGQGVAAFPAGTVGDRLRVTITGTEGRGFNQVGLSEVSMPRFRAVEYAPLPTTLDRQVAGPRGDEIAAALRDNPLDVKFGRAPGPEGDGAMRRVFTLPDERRFRLKAIVAATRAGHRLKAGRCVPIGLLDGSPVLMRRTAGSHGPGRVRVHACHGSRFLVAGAHRFTSTHGWAIDAVSMRDVSPGVRRPPVRFVSSPALHVAHIGPTSIVVDAPAAEQPYELVLAYSYDSRWHARMDGMDLVPPRPVNGFAMGWRIVPGQSGQVIITYGPQRSYVIGLVVSAVAVIAMLLAVSAPVVEGLRQRWKSR